MKATDFREWLEKISQLNCRQKEQAKHYLSEAKPQAVVDSFEPSCPVCQADRPHRWGRQAWLQRFRWRHRFLTLPAATKANHLQGIIEADETFFPSSCNGQRHLNRPPRKRGKQIHLRGTGKDQVPVLVVCDRSGATADFD